jgi:glycosyltransferase involved in cell wall biosynthesis
MNVRRILMTTDAVGGIWTYSTDLCAALQDQGIEVLLASLGPGPTATQRQAVERSGNVRLHSFACRLEWMEDPWEDVDRAGEWLLDLAEQFEPDLIHLNGFAYAALGWPVPVLVAAHSCVCSWFRAVKQAEAPDSFAEYRRRVEHALNAADLVVAPSATVLESLHACYTWANREQVLHNGCDSRLFQATREAPMIVAVGRIWDEAKNVALLDGIAPELRWPVRIAGSPQFGQQSSPSLRQVECLGQLSRGQLAALLSEAAIFAAPAKYEPFGLAVLEAALSGCALVLSDIASFREIWGEAAIYLPPDRPTAWRNALNRLVQDDTRRTQLARCARERAQALEPEQFGARYAWLYEALVEVRAETKTPRLLRSAQQGFGLQPDSLSGGCFL